MLPLLGLAAIVLYGTTRAARPDVSEAPRVEVEAPRVEMGSTEDLRRLPSPPPAPRLRSETEPPVTAPEPADTVSVDTVSVGNGIGGTSVEAEPVSLWGAPE